MATFPLSQAEIMYPIVPVPILSREIHQIDNRDYKVVAKPSGDILMTPLKLRVATAYMPTILAFIRTNKKLVVDLNTPYVYPFGNNFTQSNVYIIGHSKYFKETEVNFRIDVNFIQIAGVS